MTSLADLLALLPDNDVGAIDAADRREIVQALWYKSGIGGEVDVSGAFVKGPPTWSAERLEAGMYKITHNLGTVNYAVSITPLSKTLGEAVVPAIYETTATTFTYMTWHTGTGALHDVYTSFVVAVN